MSPVDPAGRLPGPILPWVHMRNFSPVSEMKKGRKILGASSGAKFEKQSKHGETQSYNVRANHSFVNFYSCITPAKSDAYDMENTAGKARMNAEMPEKLLA